MDSVSIPNHIGIIMDGNGRWAKKRGMPRNFGHSQGAAVFKKTINWARELGIKCVTFYAFSTENWKRPKSEIDGITALLRQYIKDIRAASKENIRIIILGNYSAFGEDIAAELADIEQTSRNNDGFIAAIALNYGGRAEIVKATKSICNKIASGEITVDAITEDMISNELYTSEMPPLDVVLRPSGEQRLSNFLIWQAAYAEFIFMDVLWPDFNKSHLVACIEEYSKRNRRYGGV